MESQMKFEDKNSFPGYIYFRDNERDYKIGLTNNLVVRGRAYKTENPRDTVVDYFYCESYNEAEAIEAEMKQAARAEGLCAFDNSNEWLKRIDYTKAFWSQFVKKYAKKTKAEWDEHEPHQSNEEKLAAFIKKHHGTYPDLEEKLAALKNQGTSRGNDHDYFKALEERLAAKSHKTP
jgi:hypothetical protein